MEEQAKAEIKRSLEYSRNNKIDFEEVVSQEPLGEDENRIAAFSIDGVDYETLVSNEIQFPSIGECIHLSLVANKSNILNISHFEEIVREFGFKQPLSESVVWVDQYGEEVVFHIMEALNQKSFGVNKKNIVDMSKAIESEFILPEHISDVEIENKRIPLGVIHFGEYSSIENCVKGVDPFLPLKEDLNPESLEEVLLHFIKEAKKFGELIFFYDESGTGGVHVYENKEKFIVIAGYIGNKEIYILRINSKKDYDNFVLSTPFGKLIAVSETFGTSNG